MKILIIGPSWIGDMVMSQGLYSTLKQQYPNCTLDVIAPNWCKPILTRMTEINNIIEMPLGHGQFAFFKRRKIGRDLIKNDYQQAYILTNSAKSALVPFFAKIPQRIGWKGEFRYGLLTDLRSNRKAFSLMIERYIALAYPKEQMTGSGAIKSLPFPSLHIDKAAQRDCFKKFTLTNSDKIIGLCPGAEFGPAKRWPAEHFAELAKRLIEQGYQIWLFGSDKDKAVTEQIKNTLSPTQQPQCENLAGRTNLIEAVDLMAACNTVVSNDSGLMHIAAAVGCKVVALYGSTSPDYTPPLSEQVKILHTDIECRPCFKRECPLKHLKCLSEISPDRVFQAINDLNNLKAENVSVISN